MASGGLDSQEAAPFDLSFGTKGRGSFAENGEQLSLRDELISVASRQAGSSLSPIPAGITSIFIVPGSIESQDTLTRRLRLDARALVCQR